jgi:hypothetical protein
MIMEGTSSTTFWSAVSIITAAMGGIFFVFIAHSAEPKHSEAAHEKDVTAIQIEVARVEENVSHNSRVLEELKVDLRTLRVEQANANREILDAINSHSRN